MCLCVSDDVFAFVFVLDAACFSERVSQPVSPLFSTTSGRLVFNASTNQPTVRPHASKQATYLRKPTVTSGVFSLLVFFCFVLFWVEEEEWEE